MQRKLVQMGKNCLMAAIPAKWLKQQNLSKGDQIEIQNIENYLLISSKKLPKDKSISLTFKNSNKLAIIRTLQILYDAGFKTVSLSYKDSKATQHILHALEILQCWKINDIQKTTAKITTISENTEDFQNQFRKQFLRVQEFMKEYQNYLKNPDKEKIEDLRLSYKITLIELMNLKRRINTSQLPLEYKYYYFIAVQLEEIIDHYEYLLRYLENKNTIPKILPKLQTKLTKLFETIYKNFYSYKLKVFIETQNKRVWKWFEIEEHPNLVYHLRAISERIKNINKYTAGIKLN